MSFEKKNEAPKFCLQNPSFTHGVQATWGVGNQLYIFPGRKPVVKEDSRIMLPCEAEIYEVKWTIDMHDSIARKLVNDSHNVFVMLQKQAQECSGSALRTHALKASKHYRSQLKACSMDLIQLLETVQDQHARVHYDQQLQIYEMIDLIWSLCEILFIDQQSGNLILSPLLEWIRWHFGDIQSTILDILKASCPEDHPEYWKTVYRSVLQGRIDKAVHLLSFHTCKQAAEFQNIIQLLEKMPIYSLFRGHSVAEFDMKWRHWREECERRLDERNFIANKQIETIARILSGDDHVFRELRELCETWYHMAVCKLLYQNPTVRVGELQHHVQGCIDEFKTFMKLGELDNILLAAIELDIHQVIKECSTFFSNWWFVAHLTDLLRHCGQLEMQRLQYSLNLRESLLLEYASSLMSHKSLWQVGLSYFDHCADYGRKYLELYIERIPLDSERKAQKILHICEKRNMQEQVRSICKVMGTKYMRSGRLGSALSWFLRSKDVAFATIISEKFLKEYTENGSFSSLDLLDHLGSNMLLSNRLTFLGKYREFHRLYVDGEFHAAGQLLLSLLSAKLAPRQFWVTLLADVLPLLEAEEIVFDSRQTYELMYCLEELTKETDILNVDEEQRLNELEKEKLDLLKLALTRNLARAIVIEGSIAAQ